MFRLSGFAQVTSHHRVNGVSCRWATKAAASSTKNGRDSNAKNLGLKKNNLQNVKAGQILIRQNGLKWKIGKNVGRGRDYTLYAKIPGRVVFTREAILVRPGKKAPIRTKSIVNVIPHVEPLAKTLDW